MFYLLQNVLYHRGIRVEELEVSGIEASPSGFKANLVCSNDREEGGYVCDGDPHKVVKEPAGSDHVVVNEIFIPLVEVTWHLLPIL